MKNHTRIIDMAVGEVIGGFYILSDTKVRKSRNDSPYLCVKLTDASGSIDARFWDYAGYTVEEDSDEMVGVASVTNFILGFWMGIKLVLNIGSEDLVEIQQ